MTGIPHRGNGTPADGAQIPLSPSLELVLDVAHLSRGNALVDRRTLYLCLLATGIGVAAAYIGRLLTILIGFFTNVAYYGRWSTSFVSPAANHLGAWSVLVPVAGGIVVGVMARFGSKAIRGHGIPEAMEQILTNESRIPLRLTFLKPLSAAVAIGTGGPFGAEGPIIATGGAFGSLVGQLLAVSPAERKTLLAAGAAAGMTAVFGSPVSAVVLAIELLLFELRPRSLIPVALAVAVATGIRTGMLGAGPMFPMPAAADPGLASLVGYLGIGLLVGVASIAVTRAVYAVEDGFERLGLHWMWWPALGGIAVGIIGLVAPLTLGVGYTNIEGILNGHFAWQALAALCAFKLLSWVIALGSGTSGGTLAPLFTIGGALGALLGMIVNAMYPALGVSAGVAGLVGMAAMFAGASRAFLTSVIFAFETTRQPGVLLPLLVGCTAAYLLSCLWMRSTIMTEKIVRRGVRVPAEYAADHLEGIAVSTACTRTLVSLPASDRIRNVRRWMNSGKPGSGHQGYPVLDENGHLKGVVTRKDIFAVIGWDDRRLDSLLSRPPIVIHGSQTLRDAADLMVRADVGRLIVVEAAAPRVVRGILTRSDILAAHATRFREAAPDTAKAMSVQTG